ncbi:hypothetical protein C4D60_Mb10t22180 [Musa balbisiana]|uniref:Uncharacterized protein n=1 Tax=Musa balbisiana TaxID=52838 RepID=A0A4S8IYV5_MUSBA|nr:hypothetical protein C4D60_Mb10t22180 [Musa balbisiana]
MGCVFFLTAAFRPPTGDEEPRLLPNPNRDADLVEPAAALTVPWIHDPSFLPSSVAAACYNFRDFEQIKSSAQ